MTKTTTWTPFAEQEKMPVRLSEGGTQPDGQLNFRMICLFVNLFMKVTVFNLTSGSI